MDEKIYENSCLIRRKRKRWKNTVSIMAAIAVFGTTYALILPAITQERVAYCGYERHSHGEDCYMQELICEITEEEADSESAYHIHDEECYKQTNNLTCKLSETEGHFHTEECTKTESVCICIWEESEEHIHDDMCYENQELIVCGQEEMEQHFHDESCYETIDELICMQEEIPPPEKHVHTESCYEEKLICDMEEHDHILQCYSDKNADLESEEEWTKNLPEELTGVWAEDLLETAKTQLGYHESTKNYIVIDEDETKGYTRYGEWYGDPYGDWCAMFVSFCLYYADIPEDAMGYEANCQDWVEMLQKKTVPIDLEKNSPEQLEEQIIVSETESIVNSELVEQTEEESGTVQYQISGEYIPKPGDLIFFEVFKEDWANHVGIVKEVRLDMKDSEGNLISEVDTIEGNASDVVKEKTYDLDDNSILGYGILPENPNYVEATTEETEELTTEESEELTTEESEELTTEESEELTTEESEELTTEESEELTTEESEELTTEESEELTTEESEELTTEETEELTTETPEEMETVEMTESFSVEGRWMNDREEERPDFVQVQLYQNDIKYGDIVELSDENGWFYIWTDLPSENSDGYEYEYYIEESPVSGYSTELKIVEATDEQENHIGESEQDGIEGEIPIQSLGDQHIVITYTKLLNQYVLPETGGIGTGMFTAGGAVLVIGSLLIGCIKIRKCERRIKKSLL